MQIAESIESRPQSPTLLGSSGNPDMFGFGMFGIQAPPGPASREGWSTFRGSLGI